MLSSVEIWKQKRARERERERPRNWFHRSKKGWLSRKRSSEAAGFGRRMEESGAVESEGWRRRSARRTPPPSGRDAPASHLQQVSTKPQEPQRIQKFHLPIEFESSFAHRSARVRSQNKKTVKKKLGKTVLQEEWGVKKKEKEKKEKEREKEKEEVERERKRERKRNTSQTKENLKKKNNK